MDRLNGVQNNPRQEIRQPADPRQPTRAERAAEIALGQLRADFEPTRMAQLKEWAGAKWDGVTTWANNHTKLLITAAVIGVVGALVGVILVCTMVPPVTTAVTMTWNGLKNTAGGLVYALLPLAAISLLR